MNTESTHLNDSTRELLTLSDEQRIEKILSGRWIGYPTAKKILKKMEDLLTHPRVHRMPNLLIVGDTNNGKTMLARRFSKLHPAEDNPGGDGINAPVLLIQAPPVPDESRFYNVILEALYAPYRPHETANKKQPQVVKLLKHIGLKILIIDEIHHILAGNLNRQRIFLNVLKHLGNELEISVIAVGTKDAFRALQTDPQLANRFDPVVLPRWDLNNDFLRLLASFERMLPLKKASNLTQPDIAASLFSMSEGYIGELSQLLNHLAIEAIHSKTEHIHAQLLKQIDWTSPSKRKYALNTIS